MESVGDWIRPVARSLLAHAEDSQVSFSYSDNGTVTASLAGERNVQLVDLNGRRKPPYRSVWVSDSHTKIRADLSRTSTDAVLQTHNRPFHQATLGAILRVWDCSLTFSPSKSRFTLLIQNFKICGEEGSPEYGRPVAIDDDGPLCQQFLELANDMRNDKEIVSPIRSQAGSSSDILSDERGYLATQEVFATQHPCGQAKGTHVRGFSHQKPLVAEIDRKSRLDYCHVTDGSADKSQNRDLLALLKGTSVTSASVLKTTGSSGNLAQASPPGEFESSFSHSLRPLPSNDIENDATPRYSKLHSLFSPSSTACGDKSKESETTTKSHLPKKNGEILHGKSDDNEENARNGSVLASNIVAGRREVNHIEQSTLLQQEEHAQYNDNPWEGLARIPRSLVRIPKDQRSLLDQEDSWYSPRVTHSNVYANLPTKLVDELTSFYGRSPSITREPDEQNTVAELIEDCPSSSGNDDSYGSDHHQTSFENTQMEQSAAHYIQPSFQLPNDSLVPSRESSEEADSENETRLSWPSSTPESIKRTTKNAQAQRIESRGSSAEVEAFSATEVFLQAAREAPLATESLAAVITVQSGNLNEKGENARGNHIFTGAITIPLSSPTEVEEMELVVPYAVDDVMDALGTDGTTKSPKASQFISSAVSQPSSRMQVARTPRVIGIGDRLQSPNQTSMLTHALGAQINNCGPPDILSSSAIIPGTFNDELAACATSPPRSLPGYDPHGSSLNSEYEQKYSTSTNKLHGSPTSSHYEDEDDKDEDDEDEDEDDEGENEDDEGENEDEDDSADQQIYAECITYSQREEQRMEPVAESNHRLFGLDGSQADVTAVTSNSVAPSSASQPSSPGRPQYPFSIQSLRNRARRDHETTAASDMQRLKRPAQDVMESSTVNRKRRRPFSPSIFGLSQEELPTLNTHDMVKANRRNFVQCHSLQGTGFVVTTENTSQRSMLTANLEPSDQTCTATSSRSLANSAKKPLSLSRTEYLEESKSTASLRKKQLVVSLGPFIDDSDGELTDAVGIELELVGERVNDDQRITLENLAADGDMIGCLGATKSVMDGYELPREAELAIDNVFERFNLAYPTYANSLQSFIRACVYIEWLAENMSAPHPFLWDDFIRVFSSEFIDYVRRCRASNQKPLSGMKFYNTKIPAPQFTRQIVTPTTLHDVLLLDIVESSAVRAAYQRKAVNGHPASQPIDDSYDTMKQTPSSLQIGTTETKGQTSLPEEHAKSKSSTDVEVSNREDARKRFFETPSQLDAETHKSCAFSSSPISPVLDETRAPVACVFSDNSRPIDSHVSLGMQMPNDHSIRNSAKEIQQKSPQCSSSGKSLRQAQSAIELKSKSKVDENAQRTNRGIPSNSRPIKRLAPPNLGSTRENASRSMNLSSKSSDQADPVAQAEISPATPTLPGNEATQKLGNNSDSASSRSVTIERRRDRNNASSTASKSSLGPSNLERKKFTSYQEAAMAYIPRRNREGLSEVASRTWSTSVKARWSS